MKDSEFLIAQSCFLTIWWWVTDLWEPGNKELRHISTPELCPVWAVNQSSHTKCKHDTWFLKEYLRTAAQLPAEGNSHAEILNEEPRAYVVLQHNCLLQTLMFFLCSSFTVNSRTSRMRYRYRLSLVHHKDHLHAMSIAKGVRDVPTSSGLNSKTKKLQYLLHACLSLYHMQCHCHPCAFGVTALLANKLP